MVVLQVAAGMMAGCLPAGSCAARIMLFAGGPPTIGSGKVVDMELTEPIRYTAVYCTIRTIPAINQLSRFSAICVLCAVPASQD